MSKKLNVRDRVENGEIDLSMTDLQEVPVREIAAVKKANSLDLSNNRISNLGKNFATLTFLVKLDLSKNQLTKLPDNFGELILLKHLDLYNNQLNHLPLSFGQLKNLKWLDLKKNPLVPALADVAGPCLDHQQCQECAKKVVKVIGDAKERLDEERKQQQLEQQQKEMAEKAAAKKEQQKNRKANKNEKKKNLENGTRNEGSGGGSDRGHYQTKKERNAYRNNTKTQQRKKSGSLIGRLFKLIIYTSILGAIFLFVVSTVDNPKYQQLKQQSESLWNKTIAALPVQVVDTTRQAADYVSPSVRLATNKISHWLNVTSTFLNTDERVKHHWSNVRSINYFLLDKISEYLRLAYKQIPIFYKDIKAKIL